jgi:hypothetical protein
MDYPQHASDMEKAAWALCTGIDITLFTFGCIGLVLWGIAFAVEARNHRKP